MTSTYPKTACIVVVGNELLNGDCLDTNSHYLQKQLQRFRMSVAQDTPNLLQLELPYD